jgi:hypothetical protein
MHVMNTYYMIVKKEEAKDEDPFLNMSPSKSFQTQENYFRSFPSPF